MLDDFKTAVNDEDKSSEKKSTQKILPKICHETSDTSTATTDSNRKPIIGALNYIPMRNEEEDLNRTNHETETEMVEKNEVNMEKPTEEAYDDQYLKKVGFENSNKHEEVQESITSMIKHEEVDMDYGDYYYEDDNDLAYSGDVVNEEKENHATKSEANNDLYLANVGDFENSYNDEGSLGYNVSIIKPEDGDYYDDYHEDDKAGFINDVHEENQQDYKTEILSSKDHLVYYEQKLDVELKLEKEDLDVDKNEVPNLNYVKNEILEEDLEDYYDDNVEQTSNNTGGTADKDQKFKIETKGIEIKLDENEVIKDRFGQIVDKMIKCASCDKVYVGKCAVKSLRVHYRNVHGGPKLIKAKNEVTKEQLENDDNFDGNVQKCDFCDKVYVGPNALHCMKRHMKSHSGIHYKCQICDKDFSHMIGMLVQHLRKKHKCENICETCKNYLFFLIQYQDIHRNRLVKNNSEVYDGETE